MLNKQGKGKIDWTDYTWNPISGKCLHNCQYCYMHSFWKRYPDMAEQQIKGNYLHDKFPKKPSKIFVGSSTDMWGEWVPSDWIWRIINKTKYNSRHTFQFLTKNPERYAEFFDGLPENAWFGTTIDGTDFTKKNAERLLMSTSPSDTCFVSFEPLIKYPYVKNMEFSLFDWIIIGADSSMGAKRPPKEWADELIRHARSNDIPVWVKDNYGYPEIIKEFPKQK